MLSPRNLAPLLALCSLLSLAFVTGTAHAGAAYICLIRSGQSETQLDVSMIDSATCSALANALSQNALRFSVIAPPGEDTPFATLACGLTFVGNDDVAQISVDIYDPGNGGESQALCKTFQQAGFDLDPDVHWGQICGPLTTGTQAGAVAALMTCTPSGFP